MTLLSPWWLLLGLLAPVVYFGLPAYRQSDIAVRASFFQKIVNTTGKQAQKSSFVPRSNKIQKASLIVAWCVLVLCAAQPVLLGNKVVQQKTARDLMVALDLSKSMNKEDFPIENGQLSSRWEALQGLMQKFAANREGDRLGLIAFGTGAYLQVPFTDQPSTWTQVVESLSTEIAGPATAIGDAIGLSIRAFDGSSAPQKVLILVTDGSDTSSQLPPIEAAKVAKTRDVKIYTIAMGNPATQDDNAKVDVDTLKQVSALTGGKSFLAMNKGALDAVLVQINQIEQSHYQQSSYQPYIYLYPYILMTLIGYYFVMWFGLSVYEWKARRSNA
ncbi:VWA domain-containing protein [Vibrio superstes]|uniref:Membrane protein n=1 Tax=Vibrio superstes NBRC 103154 TaxID=1219062 RepID=A0A511QV15_9VIBR|nr:VWA domain-containing protein [Vibrio superstes]GEM81200.1 membrane protein [Vibrio superstes NBRC 103154]